MTRTQATVSLLLILSAFTVLFGWAWLPLIHNLPAVHPLSWLHIHSILHTAPGRWVIGMLVGSLIMGALSLRK